jgi:accessory gene regulator protein AgrB
MFETWLYTSWRKWCPSSFSQWSVGSMLRSAKTKLCTTCTSFVQVVQNIHSCTTETTSEIKLQKVNIINQTIWTSANIQFTKYAQLEALIFCALVIWNFASLLRAKWKWLPLVKFKFKSNVFTFQCGLGIGVLNYCLKQGIVLWRLLCGKNYILVSEGINYLPNQGMPYCIRNETS